jgi:hypothetical protein
MISSCHVTVSNVMTEYRTLRENLISQLMFFSVIFGLLLREYMTLRENLRSN